MTFSSCGRNDTRFTPAMVMAVILLTMLGVLLYGAVLGVERVVIRDARV